MSEFLIRKSKDRPDRPTVAAASTSRHRQETINTIEKLYELVGSGPDAPMSECIANAVEFIKRVDDESERRVESWHISHCPYGTVVIEFKRGRDKVSVECGKTMIGFYTSFTSGFKLESNGRPYDDNFSDESIVAALEHLNR